MRRRISVFMLFAASASLLSAAPVWHLSLESQPGDWIGAGQNYEYDLTTATFTIYHEEDRNNDGLTDWFWVHVEDRSNSAFFWNLIFGTDQIPGDLVPGTYLDARSYAPGHPTMSIGGNATPGQSGRGCNQCFGEFTVLTPGFPSTNPAPSFAVTFVQHSESPTAPALAGWLYFNYNVPEPGTLLCVGPVLLTLLLIRTTQQDDHGCHS